MWRMLLKVRASSGLLQIKGEAEAFAVEAKGRADAEQMTKKAEAFQQYKDGAMVDMLLEKLPLVRRNLLNAAVSCGPSRSYFIFLQGLLTFGNICFPPGGRSDQQASV